MFSLNPRSHPSLPQNDSTLSRLLRERQMSWSQVLYQWNTNVATLKGVPLSKRVPLDDLPTAEWIFDVADVAIKVARNALANTSNNEVSEAETQELDALQAKLKQLRQEHDKKAGSGSFGLFEDIWDLANNALALPWAHVEEYLDRIGDIVSAASQDQYMEDGKALTLADYDALFSRIPLPQIASEFMHDDTFARMRVAGPNPMLIKRVQALPEYFNLDGKQYKKIMGETLEDALKAGRVYVLDYSELNDLTTAPGKYFCAPIALFAVAPTGDALEPVAIQCLPDPTSGGSPFYRAEKGSKGYWSWQAAKTIVQVADGNYHELFVHLARTHLLIEAFAVSTHRQLAKSHPINILLTPHFEGTLFINNQAAGGLIAKDGPIDQIFAGEISSTQRAAVADRLSLDFGYCNVPENLASRDMLDLKDYPYRDDAILVWDCIKQWVDEYVSQYYPNDDVIMADTELAAWTAELIGAGKVKGLIPIQMRQQLVDVLTSIIFTASAQHAAVNFPQNPLMSYAPAITGAIWNDISDITDITEEGWLSLLPPLPMAQEQLNVLYLLGSVYYRPLGDYRSNNFPYRSWFRDKKITTKGGPLDRFRQSLLMVEEEIEKRNRQRSTPYSFLKPSNIPTSINI